MALPWEKTGFNSFQTKRQLCQWRLNGKIAALKPLAGKIRAKTTINWRKRTPSRLTGKSAALATLTEK